MKFPKRLRHNGKGKVLATIYGKQPGRPYYRLYWRVRDTNGKPQSRIQDFPTYSAAKKKADAVVADLAKGRATSFTPGQLNDALAAYECLNNYYLKTGRKLSLHGAASQIVESLTKLGDRPLGEVVDTFLGTVVDVKRKRLSEAVEDFIKLDEPRIKSQNGERAQLSAKYSYNRAIMLRRFSATFPEYVVCDLAKEHLDKFMSECLGTNLSAKSRNHHRGAIKQFLQWCVRKDFLAIRHRLFEADSMRPEHANTAEVQVYTPKELTELLKNSTGPMKAMIAIGGLAGLRTAELMRLTWEDVWRVKGHIEVSAGKAKTRQRRLVPICYALAPWLKPFRDQKTGNVCPITAASSEVIWQQQFVKVCEQAGVTRKPNGLRHAYCTYHYAFYGNEHQTSQYAGNSPSMIHAHYKGLATRSEAQKWFAIRPPESTKERDEKS